MSNRTHREEAEQSLSASEWQQQKWGEGATDDELESANLEARRAIAYALLDVADAIREQTAALTGDGVAVKQRWEPSIGVSRG